MSRKQNGLVNRRNAMVTALINMYLDQPEALCVYMLKEMNAENKRNAVKFNSTFVRPSAELTVKQQLAQALDCFYATKPYTYIVEQYERECVSVTA